MVSLFPMVITDCAAANDAINNAKSLCNPHFRHSAIAESIASPAPILSTEVLAYASHKMNFLFFLLFMGRRGSSSGEASLQPQLAILY